MRGKHHGLVRPVEGTDNDDEEWPGTQEEQEHGEDG